VHVGKRFNGFFHFYCLQPTNHLLLDLYSVLFFLFFSFFKRCSTRRTLFFYLDGGNFYIRKTEASKVIELYDASTGLYSFESLRPCLPDCHRPLIQYSSHLISSSKSIPTRIVPFFISVLFCGDNISGRKNKLKNV
jgi:hypothetical protein